MRRFLNFAGLLWMATLLAVTPAGAQQHLLCTDTKGAGLFWDRDPKGAGRLSELAAETFTVNTVSPVRRLITKQQGGVRDAVCGSAIWPDGDPSIVFCHGPSGAETWLFHSDRTYTRSYLFGTPLQADFTDPNIYVAHGTCRPWGPSRH